MSTSHDAAPSTKARILDAAEALFARQGFAPTSLRAITAEAGVNLAAVNYHFGSKDGLLEAVFERRLGPLNAERMARLDAAEVEAPGGAPLERVLEALVGPPLRLYRDAERGGPMFVRLMGRTLAEPTEHVQEIFVRQFREIARRFTAALKRSLPGVPEKEVFWRTHFAIGALAHTMCNSYSLQIISGGSCGSEEDVDDTIERLIAFIAAGLRAPLAPEAGTGR